MPSYQAPLRDMRFALWEAAGAGAITSLPGFAEMGEETIAEVAEAAGTFCAEVLQPLNASGDEEGCVFENGVVRTPKGFPDAYRAYREGGWTALACDAAWGGQGLPKIASVLFEEMICSANLAFGMYPGLTHGVYSALRTHGSEAQKALYLPRLVDGTWSGTMCLTEPHCGTDLGLLRTRAEPAADGSYRITGTKIFISAGEHNLTPNIVHLVLARLPDAPHGSAGISLFVVPKFIPDGEGKPGVRNRLSCGAIEHKMGIRASATCVMNFDGATGWLVGAPHKGLPAMFTMMNEARLSVGMQGLGLAEVSYQNAVAYARERLQGRRLGTPAAPDKAADPILAHPDIRRILLTMRAWIEGCRMLAARTALAIDIAGHDPNPERAQAAEDEVALMTPIVKALFSDMGWEMTALGMQVLGGHGYIRDSGMEQFVRDARIAQIYEGTNGIQALDLVGRKMPAHGGRYLRRFFHPVSEWLGARADNAAMAEFVEPLGKAFGRLQGITAELARRGLADPFEVGAGASEYLRFFGLVALAWGWARAAEIALAKPGEAFYGAKLTTARFFFHHILPQHTGLAASILAGGGELKAFADADF